MDWQQQIEIWEQLIKKAHFREVQTQVKNTPLNDIPRAYLEKAANIFRRAGLPLLAIKTLNLQLLNSATRESAQDSEIIEYCMSLMSCDLHDEVSYRLKQINAEKSPSVYFYRAACHIITWDYANAIPYLEQYINSDIDDYQVALGQTNLAAALIFTEEFAVAAALLDSLIQISKQNEWLRLLANAYEMKAQIEIEQRNWSLASDYIKAQRALLEDGDAPENLYLEKLHVVIEANQSNSPEPLLKFRQRATEKEFWELVRYTDYQLIKTGFGSNSIEYLYYGTPYRSFRRKLEMEIGGIAEQFHINGQQEKTLDLATGTLNGKLILKPGQSLHRILLALTDDFYRPVTLGTLFSKTYPDEYFEVSFSANKIHQLISRFRQWSKDHSLPVELVEKNETYKLNLLDSFSIRKINEISHSKSDFVLAELLQHFSENLFAAKQAAEVFGVSKRYMAILLGREIDRGKIEKIGFGRSTKYRILGNR